MTLADIIEEWITSFNNVTITEYYNDISAHHKQSKELRINGVWVGSIYNNHIEYWVLHSLQLPSMSIYAHDPEFFNKLKERLTHDIKLFNELALTGGTIFDVGVRRAHLNDTV